MGAPLPAPRRAANSLMAVRVMGQALVGGLVGGLVVVLMLAGFATATRASAAISAATRTAPGTATAAATIVWHGCGGGFQCGTLTVPVDATPADASTATA